MPNHVANKIIVDVANVYKLYSAFLNEEKLVDFNILLPSPPDMFRGNLGREEKEKYPVNWYDWQTKNWGTKWNAYESKYGAEERKAFVYFQTAWGPPFPVINAFAEKFNIPFEHQYYDEGDNFWGIIRWAPNPKEGGRVVPVEKRETLKKDRPMLARLYWDAEELAAIDAEQEEDEETETPKVIEPSPALRKKFDNWYASPEGEAQFAKGMHYLGWAYVCYVAGYAQAMKERDLGVEKPND